MRSTLGWSTTASAATTLARPWSESFFSDATGGALLLDRPVGLWGDLWVKTPERTSRQAPHTQVLVQSVLDWTGWSQRSLARVLQVSHPTVAALMQGRSDARIGDLFARLNEIHGVVKRLHLLVNQDVSETCRLLEGHPGSGESARELLSRRHPADAYLAALDVLHGRSEPPAMRSIWPAEMDQATVALYDD